jgi:hypothetical protein
VTEDGILAPNLQVTTKGTTDNGIGIGGIDADDTIDGNAVETLTGMAKGWDAIQDGNQCLRDEGYGTEGAGGKHGTGTGRNRVNMVTFNGTHAGDKLKGTHNRIIASSSRDED